MVIRLSLSFSTVDCFWQFKPRFLLFVFFAAGNFLLGIPFLYQFGSHFSGFSERGIISGERVSLACSWAEMVFLSGEFECDLLLSLGLFRQV